ncbi:MAG: SRPBCC family protein [Deltaproteobacteria bacterium]|nr:SRPBCC family protein [Deltaproteobacteria bacterium]
MPAARQSIDIDVSPDKVMSVITDFAAYPRFVPEMLESTVLRREAAAWVVKFAVRVVRRIDYTLRLEQVSPTQLRWSLVEGTFRANNGGWDLAPLDGGARRTRADYFIDLDVGMFVPGSVMKTLVEKSLPATLAAFKGEAERRG